MQLRAIRSSVEHRAKKGGYEDKGLGDKRRRSHEIQRRVRVIASQCDGDSIHVLKREWKGGPYVNALRVCGVSRWRQAPRHRGTRAPQVAPQEHGLLPALDCQVAHSP